MRATASLLSVLWLASACAADGFAVHTPGADPPRDPLLADLLDGKLDAAGHPLGAEVVEAGPPCAPAVGEAGPEGWQAVAGQHAAGTLCAATRTLAPGPHVLNLRLLGLDEPCGPDDASCAEGAAASVEIFAGEDRLAGREVLVAELGEALVYRDHSLPFTVGGSLRADVRVEVRWGGAASVRLRYVELFRAGRRLLVDPPSGPAGEDDTLTFEVAPPAEDADLEVACGELDLTERLAALTEAGAATVELTPFRRIVTVKAAALLDGCESPRLVARLVRGGWPIETSEVWRAEPAPCDFEEGRARVLLTGFVPFPAGARSINVSELAVTEFDASSFPEASVMRVVLPVEHDSAAGIVAELVERCDPDVVVGFGQGRYRVDVETTAYNERGHADVPGGVPDNRGVARGGEPFVAGGPASLPTRLPVEPIVEDLRAAGVTAGPSDDPGRYVCNDLFFHLASDPAPDRVTGFVHLPRLFSPTDEDRERLQATVRAVVDHALLARP